MSARVATTQWSQILAARDGSDTEARDLTQAFFAEFLEKDFLASVNPEKGRFRSYLLASLRHFLSHERDRERTLRRGGGVLTIFLDVDAGEAGYAARPVTAATPEEVFDHRQRSPPRER